MEVGVGYRLPDEIQRLLNEFRSNRQSGNQHLWREIANQLRNRLTDSGLLRLALCELVSIDLSGSWCGRSDGKTGQVVGNRSTATSGKLLEEYLAELPELSTATGIPVELVLVEYNVRSQSGQSIDRTEFQRRFPNEWPSVEAHLVQTVMASNLTTSLLHATSKIRAPDVEQTVIHSAAPQGDQSPQVSTFGDYQILHEIARGGMGIVYKARQTKLNRVVAVKMILAGQFASTEHVRRFYSEAEAAAKLDHAAIVPIYEVGKIGDQHFFSMGFVDGAALSDRVSKGPLSPQVAASLIRQVAEAMAYAHQHGVIHRDLKPQNILITTDGHPKVTDFGLAKSVEGDSNITASGQILGTPSYMPPEQAAGNISEIGPLSDVYSLGAVLYCLLTGRPPFQSSNVLETLKQVLTTEPVSPRLLNPAVDRDLETICLKCLEKQPARRLKSAQDLAEELGRYLAGEPIRSRRVGPVARVARWCRRNPLPMALTILVGVLFGVAGIAWILAGEAARTKKVASIKERLQQVIDAPEISETYLKLGDSIVNELSEHDRRAAEAGRERIHAAFINQVATAVKKRNPEKEELEKIGAAIELVEKIRPDRAVELKKILQQQSRSWITLFDLKPPFSDLQTVFAGSRLATDQRLRLIRQKPAVPMGNPTSKVTDWKSAMLQTEIDADADVRIEAFFDATWRDAGLLGVSFNFSDSQGYAFTMQPAKYRQSGATSETAGTDVSAKERHQRTPWVLRLLRNGSVLREQYVEPDRLTSDVLHLQASRIDERVTLQINELTPLEFDDAFALSRTQPGRIGVIIPDGLAMTRMTVARRQRTAGTTPLDRGNNLYADGAYEEALLQFQDVALSESKSLLQQEARYKQADCLAQLNRQEESRAILMQLFFEVGERWPMLAGTKIWSSLLRERKLADAEAIYERLSTQFPFERLPAMVSDDMRSEILAAYRPDESAKVVKGLTYSPTMIREAERIWLIQKLLQPSGPTFEKARMDLYRAYLLSGDLDRVTRLVDEAYDADKSDWAVGARIHLLRLKGRSDIALNEIEASLYTDNGQLRKGFNTGLLGEHIQCLADLKRWDQVEKDLNEYRKLMPSVDSYSRRYCEIELGVYEGILLSKYGDREAAKAAFRAGLQKDPMTGQWLAGGNSEFHLLRALSGDLDAADARQFLAKFEGPQSGSLGTMLRSAITPETIVPALRDMWNSPRGREWLDKLAFWQLIESDEVRIRLMLFSLEFMRLNAFEGNATPEQLDVVWQMLDAAYRAVTIEGKLSVSQIVPLALTWKWNTSIFAWDAAANALPQPLRAQIAYVFAHRFLQGKFPDQAKRFLKIAIQNSKSDPLTKLATAELQLLEQNVGLLRLRSASSQSCKVKVTPNGLPGMLVDVDSQATLQLPGGPCELQIDAPLDRALNLSTPVVTIVAGHTMTVEIQSPWDSDEYVIPLPGLVASPARLPRTRRWQLVRTDSLGGSNTARANPSHSTVAVGGKDGPVRLWDVAAGKFTRTLIGPAAEVFSLDWHPQEKRLAAGSMDGTVHLWNVVTGQREVTLRAHQTPVKCLAWSPDGRNLVTAGAWGDTSLRLWREQGNAGPKIPLDRQVCAIAFSPDSSKFATVGTDRHLRIWNLEGQPEFAVEYPELVEMLAVAFSPDGQSVATGGYDNQVRIWKLSERALGPVIASFTAPVSSLAWSADGRQLAVGAHDGILRIFETATKRELHRSAQFGAVSAIQWKSDSSQLATSSLDSSVGFWSGNAELRKHQQFPTGLPGPIEWSRDLQRYVVSEQGQPLHLCDVSGKIIHTFPPDQIDHAMTTFSPDGKWIAVYFHSRTLSIWNAMDGSIRARCQFDQYALPILVWKPDSSQVAIALADNSIHTIDLDGQIRTPVEKRTARPVTMDWQPGENVLWVAEDQSPEKQSLLRWDLDKRESTDVPAQSYGRIGRIRWNSSGTHFVTTHEPVAAIWSRDGRAVATCRDHVTGIMDFCFSPDEKLIATVSWDQWIKVFDLEGVCQFTQQVPVFPANRIHWVGSNRIAVTSNHKSTHVWNYPAGQLLETTVWLPHTNSLTIGRTGEVLRQTDRARDHVMFVVERPKGNLDYASTETLSWDQFEQEVGIPLERPTRFMNVSDKSAVPVDHRTEDPSRPADATAPSNQQAP